MVPIAHKLLSPQTAGPKIPSKGAPQSPLSSTLNGLTRRNALAILINARLFLASCHAATKIRRIKPSLAPQTIDVHFLGDFKRRE